MEGAGGPRRDVIGLLFKTSHALPFLCTPLTHRGVSSDSILPHRCIQTGGWSYHIPALYTPCSGTAVTGGYRMSHWTRVPTNAPITKPYRMTIPQTPTTVKASFHGLLIWFPPLPLHPPPFPTLAPNGPAAPVPALKWEGGVLLPYPPAPYREGVCYFHFRANISIRRLWSSLKSEKERMRSREARSQMSQSTPSSLAGTINSRFHCRHNVMLSLPR